MHPERKYLRLRGYDYSKPGLYFITICCYNRKMLFGKIINGKMKLNEYGKIAEREWLKTSQIRDNVKLHEFIVMPNHFHAIVEITYRIENRKTGVGSYCDTTLRDNRNKTQQNIKNKTEQPLSGQSGNKRSPANSLGAIARGFESAVTKQINVLRNTPCESIWQKNFNDHIIRDKQEYFRIKTYIKNNPVNWNDDEMNK